MPLRRLVCDPHRIAGSANLIRSRPLSYPPYAAVSHTMTRFPKVRALLRRGRDLFPWRPLGLLSAAFAFVALHELAFGQLDLVFLVLGYGALGLLSLCTFFVFVGVVLVDRKLRRLALRPRTLQLETERPHPSDFKLPSFVWLPLVQVAWELETSKGLPETGISAETHSVSGVRTEHLTVAERGRREGLRRRVIVQDPFGLVRLALRHDDPLALEVLPHVGALSRLAALTALAGGEDIPHPMGIAEGDRVELRRYAPGDPARFIHWNIFARTRKLIVRMPERALIQTRRTIAYLVAGVADNASAAASRVAITAGLGDEWTFAADGCAACEDVPKALDAVVRSIDFRAEGASGLSTFVENEERRGPASLVVFAPAEEGDWLARVLSVSKGRASRMQVIIGVDGVGERPKHRWIERFLTAPQEVSSSSLGPLRSICSKLAAAQVRVRIFDRFTGRELSPAHLRVSKAPKIETRSPKKVAA
ncbi:MAG: hypothetical protein ACI9KE_001700 [Polyangiales bacterium]|jgi:hypothetical protein